MRIERYAKSIEAFGAFIVVIGRFLSPLYQKIIPHSVKSTRVFYIATQPYQTNTLN